VLRLHRLLGGLCFLAGLALTNQHTSVLVIAPLGLWVLVVGAARHGWTPAVLGKLLLWCVYRLGLLERFEG
jgi:hypothetical protein